jgi:hypothetical protein
MAMLGDFCLDADVAPESSCTMFSFLTLPCHSLSLCLIFFLIKQLRINELLHIKILGGIYCITWPFSKEEEKLRGCHSLTFLANMELISQ